VLATGRLDKVFRWRVPELLQQQGLNFDEVHLSPGGDKEGTSRFKSQLLSRLLRKYLFDLVEIWDDSLDLIPKYVALIEDQGIPVITHPIKVPPAEVECGPQDFE
jgi:hypothetical protein